jgi:DNA (cytosine-5)-methyltransferase 1
MATGKQISLEAAVKWTVFPTPTALDGKGSGKTGTLRDRLDYAAERGATKSNEYDSPPPTGGQLNPQWVEWLMGFPPEWTALDASETQ